MNIIIALIPALMWGIMPLVVAKMGGNPKQQIIGASIGAFIFSVIIFCFTSPHYTGTILAASFISGAF